MNEITTSKLLFYKNVNPSQDKYIGYSIIFNKIRKLMSNLVFKILDHGDIVQNNERALLLRFEFLKLLLTPRLPSKNILNDCKINDNYLIGRQYDDVVLQMVNDLNELFHEYQGIGSILNSAIIECYLESCAQYGRDKVKIYCRQSDIDIYREILKDVYDLNRDDFICNISDYRSSQPLEILFSFGPLRSKGFSKFHEQIFLAPIYKKLVRFVWCGLKDEQEFGSDPVLSSYNFVLNMPLEVFEVSDDLNNEEELTLIDDDIGLLDLIVEPIFDDSTQCILIELSKNQGVLIRPKTNVLVYNPYNTESKIYYLNANSIEDGLFLITHTVEADLGGVSFDISNAPLARIWKAALKELFNRSPEACLQKLHNAGIILKDPYRAIESWISFYGSVVTAPLKKIHFRLLLTKVLNDIKISEVVIGRRTIQGWERAWNEVEKSRGNAQKHGKLEHEIIDEQLIGELYKYIDDEILKNKETFFFEISSGDGLKGTVTLEKINSVSFGYSAPTEKLNLHMHLALLEQYKII